MHDRVQLRRVCVEDPISLISHGGLIGPLVASDEASSSGDSFVIGEFPTLVDH